MADSFILKGTKDVTQNVGTALRLNPSRGGDTFKFPKWWGKKQVQQYFEAAIFRITTSIGTFKLVVPVTENTILKVVHDGDGNFTFPQHRGVDRVAIVDNADNTLYTEYQFPSIVKGPILKRTVATPPVLPFATRAANADFTYNVTVTNVGDEETPVNVFTLNGVDGPGLAFSVGDVVLFDFTTVQANHPLGLFTDASKSTPYTNGVEVDGAQLLWTVAETGTFSYQCINHANMGGTITVS